MEGMTSKYRVTASGGGPDLEDAFVLRVEKDPAAWLSAWYYASTTYNMDLARDLRQWLLNNVPSQDSLGSEGSVNRELLSQVADTANAPNALPKE